MNRQDDNLYDLEKVDFLKKVKKKYIKIDIYRITIVLLGIIQLNIFSVIPFLVFNLAAIQAFIILFIRDNQNIISKFSFVYEIKFNENIGKNIREINKQIKQEKMKQKEENNLFEEEIKDDEVQVYKVSSSNTFNNNIIDMELSHTYIKKDNKTLKKVKGKVKERRY